jgi:hypothetical protein
LEQVWQVHERERIGENLEIHITVKGPLVIPEVFLVKSELFVFPEPKLFLNKFDIDNLRGVGLLVNINIGRGLGRHDELGINLFGNGQHLFYASDVEFVFQVLRLFIPGLVDL